MILGTGQEVMALLQAAEVGEEALAELEDCTSPRALAEAMIEHDLVVDAVKFLAHAMPLRAGIYWAWWCAREAAGEAPPAEVAQALATMEAWIAMPSPENRQRAFDTAHALGFDTPVGALGAAIYLSADSLAPPDQPISPPPEHAASKTVLGVVGMAAASDEEDVIGRFKAFLKQGMEVAEKAGVWATPGAQGSTPHRG